MKRISQIVLGIIIILLVLSFSSCSPAKKLERLIKKNPELIERDTITERDTIVRDRIVTIEGEVTTTEKEIQNEFSISENEGDFEFVVTDEFGKLTTTVKGVKRDGRFYFNVKTNQASETHYYKHDVELQDTTFNTRERITNGYVTKRIDWGLYLFIVLLIGIIGLLIYKK